MELRAADPGDYLGADAVVDSDHPLIADFARLQRQEHPDDVSFAAAAFEFVRDRVLHSCDVQDRRVTLSASQTLRERAGLCYGKAHLLAAVLRAERVPAGLCYQRLTDDGKRFELHGLVAIHLGGSWHRLDPRGNKPVSTRNSRSARSDSHGQSALSSANVITPTSSSHRIHQSSQRWQGRTTS